MAKEIDLDIREWAEELYIIDGLTFEETAEKTGVSISQLKRWAAADPMCDEPSWSDRRREYRNAMSNIRRDTVLLRKRMIQKALKSLDPQDVYAISSLEATAARAAKADMQVPEVNPETIKAIKTPQEAIDALQGVIEKKINAMLSQPGSISLDGIKQMKQALELIEKMKKKYKPENIGEVRKDVGPETLKTIMETIYGL